MITIESAHSPKWANAEQTMLDVTVKFSHLPHEVPFTATITANTDYGLKLFQRAVSGEYGIISPYVPTPIPEEQRVASLWQAAHDYEFAEISGSAVSLLVMGVMQGKPKCTAVQNWIKDIWELYYTRKAGTATDCDYSSCGPCPYTVPELMTELTWP